jgi:hypothetical protein
MYISIFNIYLTREYPQHRGTGSGVPQCAKNENRTHTRTTHFGNTAGLPAPVFNPNGRKRGFEKQGLLQSSQSDVCC